MQDLVTGLKCLRLHVEDQLFIGLHAQLSEVLNVEQSKLLPAPILVLILNQVMLHGNPQIGKDSHYLIESLFRYVPNIAVVFSLNISRPPVLILNQSNLSKIHSRRDDLDKSVFPVLIRHRDLALSLRNEVQSRSNLTLPNNDFLRVIHKQIHPREKYVDQLLIILQHGILLDNVLEDELYHLVLQAR